MPHVTLCRKLQNLSESVVLVPKSVPDLSTFIFRGCETLFDLITIPTWCFGDGDVELLNRKCVRCSVVTSEQRWADKGCRNWDHFTSKPEFNSPDSPKIAGAQSFTPKIKKPPKYGLVAGKVKEQQSRWEVFLKNIYFCNGFRALTPKPHSLSQHVILGTVIFDERKRKPYKEAPTSK